MPLSSGSSTPLDSGSSTPLGTSTTSSDTVSTATAAGAVQVLDAQAYQGTATTLPPLEFPIFDPMDWDGNTNWEADQQNYLSGLAATNGPTATWTDDVSPSTSGSPLPTTSAPVSSATSIVYTYTSTDSSGNIIACASAARGIQEVGQAAYYICEAPSSTVYTAPIQTSTSTSIASVPTSATSTTSSSTSQSTTGTSKFATYCQASNTTTLVGDVSQYSLNGSLITAIKALCTDVPSAGGSATCGNGTQYIPNVNY